MKNFIPYKLLLIAALYTSGCSTDGQSGSPKPSDNNALSMTESATPQEAETITPIKSNDSMSWFEKQPNTRPLAQIKLGYNTNIASVPGLSDNPEMIRAYKELHPQLLRFPGGTVSNYWDWRKGWYIDNLPENAPGYMLKAKEPPHGPITLERAIGMYEVTGATPIFVLNFYTSNLEEQLALLKHAEELGLPILYVELGNEYYWGKAKDRFPSGYGYGQEAIQWTEQIKVRFPEAQVAVLAHSLGENQTFAERTEDWNEGLSRALTEASHRIDAVILHPYSNPGAERYEELAQSGDLNNDSIKAVLATAFFSGNKVELTMQGMPEGAKVWITEYSLMDRSRSQNPPFVSVRWLHALYTAVETMNLMMVPNVDMLIYHSVLGPPHFSTHVENKYNFIYQKLFNKTPGPIALTGVGLILQQINETRNGMDEVVRLNLPLNLTGVENGNIGHPTSYPSIIGLAFTHDSEQRVILLNLSDQTKRLTKEALENAGKALFPKSAQVTSMHTAPANPIIDIETDIETTSEPLESHITLMPYSFSVIR